MTMPGRTATVFVSILAAALGATACEKDQFKGAEAEVGREKIKPDLPPVPTFTLPEASDGNHTVKEMRVNGRKFFDQDVTVKGKITWIYDCFTALDNDPDFDAQDEATIRKLIAEEPDRYCRKPLFRLGMDASESEDKTIKVVYVPRAPTALEIKLLPKEELATVELWPPVPPLAVGDDVVVSGQWKQRASTGSEGDANGLLVYGTMVNVSQSWNTADALAGLYKKKKKGGR